jgi:UDP-N-acetylenolpyruvoylglucosamine reductase
VKNTNRRLFIQKVGLSSAFAFALNPNLDLFAQSTTNSIEELKDLLKDTQSSVLLPGENFSGVSFAESTSAYNLSLRKKSEIVLLARDEEAIQRAISWADENEIKIRMRGGGHSYEGFSIGSGLVINTSSLKQIKVNQEEETAYIEAGNKLIDVIKELDKYGFAIPTGTCPTVGISGLTLGGGVGMATRKWGLTCDNLVAVHIILADGTKVRASTHEYSDLFWACRGGGGGSLGVITAFEFKLRKQPEVYTFSIKWHARDMEDALEEWQSYLKDMPKEMSCVFKVTMNGNGVLHAKSVGQVILENGIRSRRHIRKVLKPLRRVKPESFKIDKKNYMESVRYFGGKEEGSPVRFKAKSHYMKRELEAFEKSTLRDCSKYIPSGSTVAILFDTLGGAVSEQDSQESAYAHRDALCSVQYYCQWYKDQDENKNKVMMREIYNQMEPIFGPHSYVNYCDLDLRNWGYRYFGSNLEKLIAIKRSYDPNSRFDYGAQCLSRFN